MATFDRTSHLQYPPDLQLTIARMILDDIVHHGECAENYFLFGLGVPGPPYGDRLLEALRDPAISPAGLEGAGGAAFLTDGGTARPRQRWAEAMLTARGNI